MASSDLAARRAERFSGSAASDTSEGRRPGGIDRDRVLYSRAFRRLAGITQVVTPGEGVVFHNRLTHTLEVAQVGRRLAERLLRKESESSIAAAGDLDPEVVEAAALAHDLGHPPFGHIGEEELCALVDATRLMSDGFEGNAQSFRIVTVLAEHDSDRPGLDLTRATLNAILKYPWKRKTEGKGLRKWGAYDNEEEQLFWARKWHSVDDENKSLEAELMDWADEIAYSVYDIHDFYRAGILPLHLLLGKTTERESFLQAVRRRHQGEGIGYPYSIDDLETAFTEIMDTFAFPSPFSGIRQQRVNLERVTAELIGRFCEAISIVRDPAPGHRLVAIDTEIEKEVIMLKALTWHYAVSNPALATQQHGQRQIIKRLFETYMNAAADRRERRLFPPEYQERLAQAAGDDVDRARTVVDFIASLTEQQALRLYGRITGMAFGSVRDALEL